MKRQDDYDEEPNFYKRMTPEEKKEFNEACDQFAVVLITAGLLGCVVAVIMIAVRTCKFVTSLF